VYNQHQQQSSTHQKEPQSPKNNSDTETGDEETDDENDSQKLSINIDNLITINKAVEKNKSIMLPSLSILNDDEDEELDENHLSVIVHCGNVKFRVTRVPLNFCISRTSQAEKKQMLTLALKAGFRITSFVHRSSTHLITSDKTATAKTISAYALSIPIVTAQYVMALSERKQAASPLPRESDFHSEGDLEDSVPDDCDNNVQRKSMLEQFTVLSLMHSDAEMMCTCTGATIKKLYSENKDGSFWQTDTFFTELIHETDQKGRALCWLDSGSKKVKKGKIFLQKKIKEGGFQLPCLSQKNLATAILSCTPLHDIDGTEVQKTSIAQSGSKEEIHSDTNKSDAQRGENTQNATEESQPDDSLKGIGEENEVPRTSASVAKEVVNNSTRKVSNEMDTNASNEKDTKKKEELNGNDNDNGNGNGNGNGIDMDMDTTKDGIDDDEKDRHSNIESPNSTTKKKESMNSKKCSNEASKKSKKSKSSGWMSSQRLSKSSSRDDKNNSQEIKASGGWMSTSRMPKTNTSKIEIDQEDTELEAAEEVDTGLNEKHIVKLPTTDNGWLVAPKGSSRSKYKRDLTHTIDIAESAETEICQLIVHNRKVTHQLVSVSSNAQDFKRFKKNSIIAGSRMHSISEIRMVSLLPQESERRRDLEVNQEEQNKQERAADALFADESGRGRRGIRSFMTPLSTSSRRRR
jgi:hypothetical protein